jgi:nicotinamide riboside kinase
MIRRINLFGGPGTGKSTMAASLYSELKNYGNSTGHTIQTELVREYVKNWAWENRKILGYDQFYIFAKQLRAEELCLRNGVDVIITDSPIALAYMYSVAYNLTGRNEIRSLVQSFEKEYPSKNIFLKRDYTVPYNQKGRYQNLEEAKQLDNLTLLTLKNLELEFTEVPAFNESALYTEVYKSLGVNHEKYK